MTLLAVKDLVSGYGKLKVLHGISMTVDEGEIVSVLGANGAGKTTFLRTVSGILPTWSGSVTFSGKSLVSRSIEGRAAEGIGHLPEGRGVFQNLTVRENLNLGGVLRKDCVANIKRDTDALLDLLPVLREKLYDPASSLSGGQQQMLSLARAMLSRPRLLMVDELSFGLAPKIFDMLFALVSRFRNESRTAFLLVEQNARVLDFSDRTYVLKQGMNDIEGPSPVVRASTNLLRSYLGHAVLEDGN
jgi:branched-chain amino acid transport system ATP-binding protein